MITDSAVELLRVPVTRSRLRELVDRRKPPLGEDERRALDLLQRELQDDLDMDDDPDFAELLAALRSRLDRNRLTHALYRPHLLVEGLAYPLLKGEVQQVCAALGVDVDAQEVERLATAQLILRPVVLGTSSIPRRGFFARHLVQIIYERLLLDDIPPAIEQAHLKALRGQLEDRIMVYYRSVTATPSTRALSQSTEHSHPLASTKVGGPATGQPRLSDEREDRGQIADVPIRHMTVSVHCIDGRVELGESDATTLTARGYPIFTPRDSGRVRWIALRDIKYVVLGSLAEPDLEADPGDASHIRRAILRFGDGEWMAAYLEASQPADGTGLAIKIRLTERRRVIPAIAAAHALREVQFVDRWATADSIESGRESSVGLLVRQMEEMTKLVKVLHEGIASVRDDRVTGENLALLRAASAAVQGLRESAIDLDSLAKSLEAADTPKGAFKSATSGRSARTRRDL